MLDIGRFQLDLRVHNETLLLVFFLFQLSYFLLDFVQSPLPLLLLLSSRLAIIVEQLVFSGTWPLHCSLHSVELLRQPLHILVLETQLLQSSFVVVNCILIEFSICVLVLLSYQVAFLEKLWFSWLDSGLVFWHDRSS